MKLAPPLASIAALRPAGQTVRVGGTAVFSVDAGYGGRGVGLTALSVYAIEGTR